MGELTDKIKGSANEAAGNVKQAVDKATDNERMVVDGKTQERKGEAQQVKGALGDDV